MKTRLIVGMAMLAGPAGTVICSQQEAVLLHLGDDFQQVRVEALDVPTGRWLAIASGYREAADSGWLKIALPEAYTGARLRVLGSAAPSPFAGKILVAAGAAEALVDAPLPTGYWPPGVDSLERDKAGEEPVIEEADIWAWEDSILYFYNQYRGLQVLDLSEPARPRWLAYYRYPARGEDLYALGGGRVVLIGTGAWWNDQSVALQFLSFRGRTLVLEDSLELGAGQYLDSRRYGDYLYVLTREWISATDPDGRAIQAPLVRLHTVALFNSAGGRLVDVKSFRGDGWLDAVLTAQPDGILLSLNRWHNAALDRRFRWRSEVHVLVPGTDGVPQLVGIAPVSGIIHDKFKLNYRGGLLTAISQQADWMTGSFTRATMLENFRLGERGFVRVGALQLAPGETVFASRFYGDTVYIVTFLFVDPLFAVDNSNPALPRIAGELKVPGWSNYLEWVDDQLFAVGIEEQRLNVSIFDVADPANMRLKDRVYLDEESWAWSEAQYDDQAISFFPEARLLLLPFTTWSWRTGTQVQAMQLISWDEAGLRLRGRITHLDTPRRGILHDATVITVSGRQLVTTDITDPDLPVAGGTATLAWNVTRLMSHRDYWLQLDAPDARGGVWAWRVPSDPAAAADPVLYVTAKTAPNIPVAEIPLAAGRLLGAVQDAQRLYLLQDVSPASDDAYWKIPDSQQLAVRAYDIANPLAPLLLGEAQLQADVFLGSSFTGRLLPDGALVWSSDGTAWRGWYYLDIWPGPWIRQNTLSFVVSAIDADGAPFIAAWKAYPLGDFYSHTSGWHWKAPVLAASVTSYVERPRPETYPDYVMTTRLLALDFSVPDRPLELPPTKLPDSLVALDALPDGINHFLYFTPAWNVVEVWGWDRARAFPLFRQELLPDSGTAGGSYSAAWMPPFHLRHRYRYDADRYVNSLEAWFHAAQSNRFLRVGDFPMEDQWLGAFAAMPPWFLQLTNRRLHLFESNRHTGAFTLWDAVDLPFPQIYDLRPDAAVLMPEAAYLPAGLYGVEVLPWNRPLPGPTDAALLAAAAAPAGAAEWTLLDESRWQRVPLAGSDAAGVLDRLLWLYRPDSLREPDPQAADAGDLARVSAWFGRYVHQSRLPGWIDHQQHGLLYVQAGDQPEDRGFHLYDATLGYLWTSSQVYPFLYAYRTGRWLCYIDGTGAEGTRWFYAFGAGWFGLTR